MTKKKLTVDVLATTDSNVKVKLPFLRTPITMTYNYFKSGMRKGYFKIKEGSMRKLPKDLKVMAEA